MTLAKVKCAARSRSTTHKVPESGRNYRFRSGEYTEVSELVDVRYFEEANGYTVDWTAHGKLKDVLARDEDSPKDALKEFSYNAKQSLAKGFGIKANQSEEDLEEELIEVANEMKEDMEEY